LFRGGEVPQRGNVVILVGKITENNPDLYGDPGEETHNPRGVWAQQMSVPSD